MEILKYVLSKGAVLEIVLWVLLANRSIVFIVLGVEKSQEYKNHV